MQQTFIICNHICKPQFYQVSYESEAVLDIYIKEGFKLLTVYHRSNQLKEVQRDIIDPWLMSSDPNTCSLHTTCT